MKKSRIEKLIPIANNVLKEQYDEMLVRHKNEENNEKKKEILNSAILRSNDNKFFYIKSNYDGKVSGFGIAVALSGVPPALAMYFNESGEVKTRPIPEAIAKIIVEDKEYSSLTEATAEGLLQHALDLNEEALKNFKKYIIEASIALKQIVRTYELV